MKRNAKNFVLGLYEKYCIYRCRRVEINKFNDDKRKEIYTQITLSPEQMKMIDEIFISNYGKRIPYTWHRHFTAFTGQFDKYYFPELLYIPEFERFQNQNQFYAEAFMDKNLLPLIANEINIEKTEKGVLVTPKVILSSTAGLLKDSHGNIVDNKDIKRLLCNVGECFYKLSTDSCSGEGCRIMNFVDGVDTVTNLSIDNLEELLMDNFVLQERIVCHESIRRIYSEAVNTFRIITYRWENEILYMPIIMRIGQGGANLDNAHAGGMFIALDDDGTMHDKAFTEFKDEYTVHPDTNVVFAEQKIELLPKVINAALKMHSCIPQLGSINWDFTIDREGRPVLIEANCTGGSIWLIEMAHGKGVFGDRTPEILRWIRFMKTISPSERKKYAFGKMN